MTPVTAFLGGRLQLEQPARGYRFSLDAPLLAHFIRCNPNDTLLEIGTGVGIIPLILSLRRSFRILFAVEIQSGLAEMARRNIRRNGAEDRIQVIQADIRKPDIPGLPERVDVVFANPPYRRVGDGRLNPQFEKAAARHELLLDLPMLMQAADRHLGPDGRFFLTHLPVREEEVCREARRHDLYLQRRREVFSCAADRAPFLVLLHFSRHPASAASEPPLHVHGAGRTYSPEFEGIISPKE
jgi:tRNA1Val (adenine37-N6)-methyltransferase